MIDDDYKSHADESWGQGELLKDPGRIRSDCQKIERYPSQLGNRAAMVARLTEIVETSGKPREVVMATKALAALDRLNLDYRKDDRESQRESDNADDEHNKITRFVNQLQAMKGAVPTSAESTPNTTLDAD